MAVIDLPQSLADTLSALPKSRVDSQVWRYPYAGGKVVIPLRAQSGAEEFFLDLYRGKNDPAKESFQNRARGSAVLARLDKGGPPHRNPDKEKVDAPHLHIYREGYGDRWAVPAPVDIFTDLGDTGQTLRDFMGFVNITNPPYIR